MKLKNSTISGNDLGFGNKPTENHQRTLNRDGSSNIKRIGLPFFRTADTYNSLITMNWLKFSAIILSCYLIINIVFASLYVWIGVEHFNGITWDNPDRKVFRCIFLFGTTISIKR